MYLFNPFYVISNVIYIEPERSYILLEKKCWNSLIGRIFKGRRATSKELKYLKDICYGLYVKYISTGNIESERFNFGIAKLQGVEEYVHKVDLKVENFISEEVELKFEEEGFFSEEAVLPEEVESINPHPLIAKISKDKIINQTELLSLRNQEMEEETRSLINININLSLSQAKLINSIGYGRILSLFRNLMSSGSVKLFNDIEKYFVLSNESIIYSYLNLTQKYHSYDVGAQFHLYYCDECNMINDHQREFVNIRNDPQTEKKLENHAKSVVAWSKHGRFPEAWFLTIQKNNYVFNYISRIPQLSVQKIFNNFTDFNFVNIALNIEKQEKYIDEFNSTREYMLSLEENKMKFVQFSTDLEVRTRDTLQILNLDSESYLTNNTYEFDMFKYFSDGNYKEFLKSKEVSQQALSLVSENNIEIRTFKPFGFK